MSIVTLKDPDSAEALEIRCERMGDRGHVVHWADCRVEVDCEFTADGSGQLYLAGAVLPFHVVQHDAVIEVWLCGRVHTYSRVDRSARRAAAHRQEGVTEHLTAPMPGTILQIQVVAGDRFAAHQPLITMESMKMEMTLSAPHAGQVEAVHCREGQLVELGALLATLQPEEV